MVVHLAVTAYTSRAAETDGDPCRTASGMDVCERNIEDVVATNFAYLPFGTRLRIPELFGNRIFQVQDRMNERYGRTVDVWMTSLPAAKKFGHRWAMVEIF
jgi:3D (Asp-Asp-Asp) domain-containing protein